MSKPPKKAKLNKLITAWAIGDETSYRSVYNSLSENEKKHIHNIGFNWNFPAEAAVPTESNPLNPNAAPFKPAGNESEGQITKLMTNLDKSGSKLSLWLTRGGKKRKSSKTRRRK